jgi:hypothetical protein
VHFPWLREQTSYNGTIKQSCRFVLQALHKGTQVQNQSVCQLMIFTFFPTVENNLAVLNDYLANIMVRRQFFD